MPDFTPDDLDISPGEFIDACSKRDIDKLIEILIEDGHIKEEQTIKHSKQKGNINDKRYFDSLDKLSKCRDLLSIEEEDYINNLAEKFKHLR